MIAIYDLALTIQSRFLLQRLEDSLDWFNIMLFRKAAKKLVSVISPRESWSRT